MYRDFKNSELLFCSIFVFKLRVAKGGFGALVIHWDAQFPSFHSPPQPPTLHLLLVERDCRCGLLYWYPSCWEYWWVSGELQAWDPQIEEMIECLCLGNARIHLIYPTLLQALMSPETSSYQLYIYTQKLVILSGQNHLVTEISVKCHQWGKLTKMAFWWKGSQFTLSLHSHPV